MAQAQIGDTVKVHYTGKLQDGETFDSSIGRNPLKFEIGGGKLLQAFEQAVVGMEPGESKSIQLVAQEAYGDRDDALIWTTEKSKLPDDLDPAVGQQLEAVRQDGVRIPVFVIDVAESTITLDANHPLAGEDLTFDLQLVEIGSAIA